MVCRKILHKMLPYELFCSQSFYVFCTKYLSPLCDIIVCYQRMLQMMKIIVSGDK